MVLTELIPEQPSNLLAIILAYSPILIRIALLCINKCKPSKAVRKLKYATPYCLLAIYYIFLFFVIRIVVIEPEIVETLKGETLACYSYCTLLGALFLSLQIIWDRLPG